MSSNSINNQIPNNSFKIERTDTGDPFTNFSVGAQQYSLGIDNSDSDKLKITDNADPSTGNTLWQMESDGNRTIPSQTAFYAKLSATIPNVTGTAQFYTIPFDTVVYNAGNHYDNTTGIFTAPVTGFYLFNASIASNGYTSHNNYETIFQGSESSFTAFSPVNVVRSAAITEQLITTSSYLVRLSASDTIETRFVVDGGPTTISVLPLSYFSGYFLG